jgi:hypothetical protein
MVDTGSGGAPGMQRRGRTPYSAGYRSETASERARCAALNRFTYSGGFDGYEGRMTCPPAWRRTAFREEDARGERSGTRT